MKWFFRWLYAGLKTVENETNEDEGMYVPSIGQAVPRRKGFNNLKIGLAKASTAGDEHHVNLSQSPLVFRLYPATGGHIVEYSYYDEKTDRNTQALHLIASGQDLGDSLSKIMTLEALRR